MRYIICFYDIFIFIYRAYVSGGALHFIYALPSIYDSKFINNSARYQGGAIFILIASFFSLVLFDVEKVHWEVHYFCKARSYCTIMQTILAE